MYKFLKIFVCLAISLFLTHHSPSITQNSLAADNPLSAPNNKVGIHIISPTQNEAFDAATLVNSSGGDWGYVTVVIEEKDQVLAKWQNFFNILRRSHLIPIVRLATQPTGDYWQRPSESDAVRWADFLAKLTWPTKNRYVTIYNEPNHATEWGNSVDAKSYARVLDETITALKMKSNDFFVLNGGFDASAPQKLPAFEDEANFLAGMNAEVPGIFSKLDGWVSHSYPNPGFVGLPTASGRGTINTWAWELQVLKSLGVTKNLGVFITETGWKHSEGIKEDPSLPTSDVTGGFYKIAFENSWASPQVVAVTPFLLNYQQEPFDHFSFKKITGEKQEVKILSAQYPQFYPQYQTLSEMPKTSGHPIQENRAKLTKGAVYSSLVAGQSYDISITFKNIGESIWNEVYPVRLIPIQNGVPLNIQESAIPQNIRIEPDQEYTFNLKMKAPDSGSFLVVLNLFVGNKQFESDPVQFTTVVKPPVILKTKAQLKWKNNFSGEYLLNVAGIAGNIVNKVVLGKDGTSDGIEARYLLPDYEFSFTLSKPFYQPKSIRQKVVSGENLLDFRTLQPEIFSVLLNPYELWKLLPFSN